MSRDGSGVWAQRVPGRETGRDYVKPQVGLGASIVVLTSKVAGGLLALLTPPRQAEGRAASLRVEQHRRLPIDQGS